MGRSWTLAVALFSIVVGTPAAAEPIDEDLRGKIRTAVRAKLNDPDSARFRWLPRVEGSVYCGFVNAKNRLGGYAGFAPFMVMIVPGTRGPVVMAMDVSSADPSSSSYRARISICQEKGMNMSALPEDDPSPSAAPTN